MATTGALVTAVTPARRRFGLSSMTSWMRAAVKRPVRALTVLAALTTLAAAGWLLGQQAWAAYHWRAAQAEARLHHYRQVKDHIIICHRVWPEDRATLLLAARAARRLNLHDEADGLLTQYHRLHGDDDDLILERVLLRVEQGEVDAISGFCRTLVANEHPQTPYILEALIAGYLRLFRLHEAKFCVDVWQEREPDDAEAENLTGHIFELKSQFHDAVKACRRAVELDPGHDEARTRLARLLLDLSQADEALPHLRQLAAKQPDNVEVLVELARCLGQLDQQPEAEQTLGRARDLQPDHAGALQESGLMALRRGALTQAETWLKKASTLAPGNHQVHYQLALCWQRLGKTDEARALEPKLKQLEEDNKRLQEIMVQQMARAPNDPKLHFDLGMILLRAGAVKEALRWFDSALKIDPNHAPTHEVYATYYQRMGQFGRAARHLEFLKSKTLADAPAKTGP